MPIVGPKFGQVMIRTARAVESGRKATVAKAADVAKTEQLKVMRPDSGGDLRLSGVGRAKGRAGNARIGVQVKMKGSGEASVRASGPLQIINNDTGGRVIRSAYQSGRYRRASKMRGGGVASQFIGPALPGVTFTGDRRAVLNIPGVGYRRSARHPGTKGKQTWQRGQEKATPKILKALGENMTNIIHKAARP